MYAYHSCMACTQNCRYFVFTFIRISNSICVSENGNERSLFGAAKSLSFVWWMQRTDPKKIRILIRMERKNKNPNCDLIRWHWRTCAAHSVNSRRRLCTVVCTANTTHLIKVNRPPCTPQEPFVQHVNKICLFGAVSRWLLLFFTVTLQFIITTAAAITTTISSNE